MDSSPHDQTASGHLLTRAIHLALACVIGLAFVGFFVGIRQGKTIAPVTPPRSMALAHPAAIPATSYRDLDRRKAGINRGWRSTLADLAQPQVDLTQPPRRTEPGRAAVLAARAARRAYDGAPPTVPHPIDQMSAASCLACHGEGLSLTNSVRAPKMSHAMYASCTQCHVEQASTQFEAELVAESLAPTPPAPTRGTRAWPGAPPTVPHATWMRANCLGCHGPTGAEPIRTTHPLRANCLQCHAVSAVLDQAAYDDQPVWLDHDLLPTTGELPP